MQVLQQIEEAVQNGVAEAQREYEEAHGQELVIKTPSSGENLTEAQAKGINSWYTDMVIEDVIDGILDEDALCEEEYPSESTLERWRRWAEELLPNMEGHIRSAAYRILDMTDGFLADGMSLLDGLKERLNYGWLASAMRIYINSGGT